MGESRRCNTAWHRYGQSMAIDCRKNTLLTPFRASQVGILVTTIILTQVAYHDKERLAQFRDAKAMRTWSCRGRANNFPRIGRLRGGFDNLDVDDEDFDGEGMQDERMFLDTMKEVDGKTRGHHNQNSEDEWVQSYQDEMRRSGGQFRASPHHMRNQNHDSGGGRSNDARRMVDVLDNLDLPAVFDRACKNVSKNDIDMSFMSNFSWNYFGDMVKKKVSPERLARFKQIEREVRSRQISSQTSQRNSQMQDAPLPPHPDEQQSVFEALPPYAPAERDVENRNLDNLMEDIEQGKLPREEILDEGDKYAKPPERKGELDDDPEGDSIDPSPMKRSKGVKKDPAEREDASLKNEVQPPPDNPQADPIDLDKITEMLKDEGIDVREIERAKEMSMRNQDDDEPPVVSESDRYAVQQEMQNENSRNERRQRLLNDIEVEEDVPDAKRLEYLNILQDSSEDEV
ncbi:hypothetical protein AAMO2058_000847300 [Amorphochlora amoebiformis]